MFSIVYTLTGHLHVHCVCRTSENCWSLVLQDKCNIEIFLTPDTLKALYTCGTKCVLGQTLKTQSKC